MKRTASRTARDPRRPLLALLCAAQVLNVLGVTVFIVALPAIADDLSLPAGGLQLVVSVYALFFGGLLLAAGRVADVFDRRRVFLVGLAAFIAGSVLCGLAPSAMVLLAGRAVQGLGAALVVPAALSVLTTTFSAQPARRRALGVWTATAAGGGAAGFFLGGIVADTLGWRWVFLLNVPVGLLALAATPRLLTAQSPAGPRRRLDLAGAVIATGGLMLLVWGAARAESAGPAALATWGPAIGGLVLLGAFFLVERRVPDPLLPPGVFRDRALAVPNLVAFVNTATTSASGTLVALVAQQSLGLSARATGVVLLPFSLAVIGGSVLGSRLLTRGARTGMAAGLGLVAAGTVVLAAASAAGAPLALVAGVALSGLGLGWAAVASTAAATAALPAHQQGLASGLVNTAAQLGTAIGVAVLLTIAALRTETLLGDGVMAGQALVAGFTTALLVAAALAALGAAAAVMIRRGAARR